MTTTNAQPKPFWRPASLLHACAVLGMGSDKCHICKWRRFYIQSEDPSAEDTNAPIDECDSEVPHILAAFHTYPGQAWMEIISTGLLSRCSTPVPRGGQLWIRIPLRLPEHHCTLAAADYVYTYEGTTHGPSLTVTGYHNCHLESLMHKTTPWPNCPVGTGILREGRLRYGILHTRR